MFPLVVVDTNWWVLHAEQMMTCGERVCHSGQDNAPDERDARWSSPLLCYLAALAWHFRTICGVGRQFLFGAFIAALFAGVARRFETATAAFLLVAFATAGPLLDNFSARTADHRGMAAVLCLIIA